VKNQIKYILFALVLLSALNSQLSTVHAQGTAFTYQGQLQNNGSPASGTYNLTFTVFGTNTTGVPIAEPVTNNAVFVTNGLFTVQIDFGPDVFIGTTNWLEIGVESNGFSSFTILTPRQQLTPVPYAIDAENANNLPGLLVQPNTAGAPNLIGGSPANFVSGGVVGATIGGGGATNYLDSGDVFSNSVTADFATVGGGAQNTAGYAATVGGGNANTASGDDATVGGGVENSAGYAATVGGGQANTASGGDATVGGGAQNTAGNAATVGGGQINTASGGGATVGGGTFNTNNGNYATVGGGEGNTILVNSTYATISGGYQNIIAPGASFSTIGGGDGNAIYLDGATNSTIAGGYNNVVLDSDAFIGGGEQNLIEPGGTYATIPGGTYNTATGTNSFAAGSQANANDNGSFVWSDGTYVSSFGLNTFMAHASGGFQFELASSTVAISPSGTVTAPAVNVNGTVTASNPNGSALTIGSGAIHVTGAGTNTATAAFIQVTTTANIVFGINTLIDNPLCNGDPNAILIITINSNPGSAGVLWNHPVGAYFLPSSGAGAYNKWSIISEDTTPMPAGLAFNVLIIKN
jgi:hypothetical protein